MSDFVDRATSSVPGFVSNSKTFPGFLRSARPFATSMVIATMAVVACLGYSGAFARWTYLVPVVTAVAGASAVAVAARHKNWFVGEALFVSTAAFFLVGILVTQWIPGVSSPVDFASALANGWADLLSSQPPVDLSKDLAVVPFTTAWMTTAIAQELDRRVHFFGIALVGVLVGFIGTSLFSTEVRSLAIVQGPVLIGLTLVLALMQRRRSETASGMTVSQSSKISSSTTARAGAMLLLIGLIAAMIGPRLPLANDRDRFDLRDYQDHPWDPLNEPSPLVTLKAALKEGARDEILFVATSPIPITRWSLAVMESYDGVVWEVADPNGDAPAQFVPVDSQFPSSQTANQTNAAVIEVEIEIAGLAGPWVPHAGLPLGARFDDGTALRMNLDTTTLAAPAGFEPGTTYSLRTAQHPTLPGTQLQEAQFSIDDDTTALDLAPSPILNLAAELVEGVDRGGPQVTAIQNLLITQGFYDAGQARPPGHSYAQITAFIDDPTRIVGYEEQYAATAAVLARAANIPSRVVVGYQIDAGRYQGGVAEIRSDDTTAWIEVLVEGVGWVPIDVTPDRSREPTDESLGRVTRNVAVPNEPPPPPPPLDTDLLDPPEEEVEEDDEQDDDDLIEERRSLVDRLLERPGVVAGTVALSPFVVFGFLALLAVGLKMRRTRRRRNALDTRVRIAGAWAEMLDRFQEAGHDVRPNAAPLEIAEDLLEHQGVTPAEPAIRDLVSLVSKSAFAAESPSDADADRAWQCAESAGHVAAQELDPFERLKVRADPRPLLRPTPGPKS